jgi:serine/threonine protein kinase
MHHADLVMEESSELEVFATGDRVGDYAIDRELAREQSGVVYQATHLLLPRKAHVKVANDREYAKQLLREACLLEALQHAGIPRVYECGILYDRRPWVAYQRVDGMTLGAAMGDGPMAVADLVVLLRDLADILVHAHARGVVHSRISPDTIVRTPDRALTVHLRGWSLARTVESTMSLDTREDVYALGGVAFRALTGCLHTPNVSATDWCPSAPTELTALIDVMLDATARVRPTSEEVRERATWLSSTLEISKPRWTPPHGLDPAKLDGARADDAMTTSSAFSIRITK